MKYKLENYEHFLKFGNYITPRSIEVLKIIISKLKDDKINVNEEIEKSEILNHRNYFWVKEKINKKIKEREYFQEKDMEFCNEGGYPMLSKRILNCLQNANIKTIEELKNASLPRVPNRNHEPNVKIPKSHVLRLKNFGRKSYNEVLEYLREL